MCPSRGYARPCGSAVCGWLMRMQNNTCSTGGRSCDVVPGTDGVAGSIHLTCAASVEGIVPVENARQFRDGIRSNAVCNGGNISKDICPRSDDMCAATGPTPRLEPPRPKW